VHTDRVVAIFLAGSAKPPPERIAASIDFID
jgi:hypothetical protein